MSLAHPFLALLFVPILVAIAASLRLATSASGRLPGSWPALVEPALRGAIATSGVPQRRWQLALCLVIAGLLALALARPMLDRGGGMFADIAGRVLVMDVRPGASMTEQRAIVGRLLEGAPDIPAAVVAAAGDAHDIVPLTTDRRTLLRYLNVLEPELMPAPGRALHAGLARAEALLADAGVAVRQIVVVSDGEAPESSVPIAPSETMRVVAVATDQAAWDAFSEAYQATVASPTELAAVGDSLRREIARKVRTETAAGALDLTPLAVAAAMLLWLGLFRRRADL